jgi:uncharacterized protein involved in exopolysaccharide biosynthesis
MVDVPIARADPASAEIGQEVLRPLGEHRAFITVFVLSAVLSALALTYIYSERFRAEATIFFKPSEVTRLTSYSTQALGSPFPSNTAFKAVDQTIFQLVDSDALLRQVVLDLHLEVPEPRDISGPWYVRYYQQGKYALEDFANETWQVLQWGRVIDDPVAAAVASLRSRIKVTSLDSYAYRLNVTARSPRQAVTISDNLGAHLISSLLRVDLRSTDERRQRLAMLRDSKARDLEDIETKMHDLLASGQIASLPDELTEETKLASHLVGARADTTADLRQSEAKLAEVTDKLRVLHPEPGRDPAETRPASRIAASDYIRLTSERLDERARSRGLSAKLASLERSGAAANARLLVLNQIQARYDLLSAQLNAAKRDFSSLSDAYQEAVIQATTGQSELHLQAEATAPPIPISPIKVYHVAAAGFLALLIAVGLAYVLDYFGINLFLPPSRGGRRRVAVSRTPVPPPDAAPASVAVD